MDKNPEAKAMQLALASSSAGPGQSPSCGPLPLRFTVSGGNKGSDEAWGAHSVLDGRGEPAVSPRCRFPSMGLTPGRGVGSGGVKVPSWPHGTGARVDL